MIRKFKRYPDQISADNPVIIPQRRGEIGYCVDCDARMYSKLSPHGDLMMACFRGSVHTGAKCSHINAPSGRKHKVVITGQKINLLKALKHMIRVRPARRGPGGTGGNGPQKKPGPKGGPKGLVVRPPRTAKEIVETKAFHDLNILTSRVARHRYVNDYVVSWQGQRGFFRRLFATPRNAQYTIICAIAIIPDHMTIEHISGWLYCWLDNRKKYLRVNAHVADNIDPHTRTNFQTEILLMRDVCMYRPKALIAENDERDWWRPHDMIAIVAEWRVRVLDDEKVLLETVLHNRQQVAVIPHSPVAKWDHMR